MGICGQAKKKEPLIYKGSESGRNRTRTCDPIDVNDVLSLGGKVWSMRMRGVHPLRTVGIIGLPDVFSRLPRVRRKGVQGVFKVVHEKKMFILIESEGTMEA